MNTRKIWKTNFLDFVRMHYEQNLLFYVFGIWEIAKKTIFMKKMFLSTFPPGRQLTKWTKFSFSRFLLTNVAKKSFWVGYTFLQNPLYFSRFNILEENCGADIKNGTFKCKTFVDKCCKKLSLDGLYFPTKAPFFFKFQHFRRKLWCQHQRWNI